MARVRGALIAAGAVAAADRIRVLEEATRTAAQAAAALGVGPAQIANSLVFLADDRPLLVLSSGGRQVDLDRVAAAVGARHVARADAGAVRAATGFAIGGVAPVGHLDADGRPHQPRTVVDTALRDVDVVWAAAGHPRTVFPTTYDELVRITGGTPAAVGEDHEDE